MSTVRTNKHPWASPFLSLVLLNACAFNIGAGAPLGAALASCSRTADAARMVPDNLIAPPSGWAYHIADVRVMGPTKSTIPPPILATTFGNALERTLRRTELLQSSKQLHDKDFTLIAHIVSQTRQETFKKTTLELVVSYSLTSQLDSNKNVWDKTITTNGEINDWKTDACERLRKLQEQLARENIRRLFNALPTQK